MPEAEFMIDAVTGEFQLHVDGVAGPAWRRYRSINEGPGW